MTTKEEFIEAVRRGAPIGGHAWTRRDGVEVYGPWDITRADFDAAIAELQTGPSRVEQKAKVEAARVKGIGEANAAAVATRAKRHNRENA